MGKTAFIFPGQGAQKAGMGKDFYEKYDTAKKVFDSASKWLDLDMKALCFEENDKLDLTEYTQAALVTTCLAMEKVVEEMGLHPDVTAGLSLGEYCAIEAAGASFEELELLTLGGLRKAVVDGDVKTGSVMSGQIAGMVKDIPTCKDLMARLMAETKETVRKNSFLAEE